MRSIRRSISFVNISLLASQEDKRKYCIINIAENLFLFFLSLLFSSCFVSKETNVIFTPISKGFVKHKQKLTISVQIHYQNKQHFKIILPYLISFLQNENRYILSRCAPQNQYKTNKLETGITVICL